MCWLKAFSVLVTLTCTGATKFKDPSTDHQTETYEAMFDTIHVNGEGNNMDLSAYFGPEHSTDTQVNMINSANISIDITTSSSSSWLDECQPTEFIYNNDDDSTCAVGCSPNEQRLETFSLFPAIINALHRGVNVRILTNDVNTPDCPGKKTTHEYIFFVCVYDRM